MEGPVVTTYRPRVYSAMACRGLSPEPLPAVPAGERSEEHMQELERCKESYDAVYKQMRKEKRELEKQVNAAREKRALEKQDNPMRCRNCS